MTVEQQEKIDVETRAAGKTSRAFIMPLLKKISWRAWAIIAVIVGALIVGRIVLYEVRRDTRNITIAELAEKHADEVKTVSDKLGKELATVRQEKTALIRQLDEAVKKAKLKDAVRKTKEKVAVAAVRSHTTTAKLSEDVRRFLELVPESVTETTMTFSVPDVQNIVIWKIERDALILDVESLKHQLGMEEQRVLLLQEVLTKTDTALIAANNTIKALETEAAAYKRAAKKSLWGKFLGGAKTVGTAVIPAVIVWAVMR